MENVPSGSVGPIVEVQVIEVISSGLQVKILETGKKGFVPRREISWERRVSVPVKFPEPGEKHFAIIYDDKKRSEPILSLRKTKNPWREQVIQNRKYKKGDLILGEVVNVRHFGAYVQLEPGIDGVIYPREVSFLPGQNIEDVLWVGDRVVAEILDIDNGNQIIELSVTRAQQRKSFPISVTEQANELLTTFSAEVQLPFDEKKNQSISATFPLQKKPTSQRIHKLSHILIVDDEKEWQESIKTALEKKIRAEIDVVTNKTDVIGKLQQGAAPYSLVLIDINLGEDSGIDLAQDIRETHPYLPILLISAASLAAVQNRYSSQILLDEFTFAQKDIEVSSILQKINEMSSGFEQTSQLSMVEEHVWMQRLGATVLTEQDASKTFFEILKWLCTETATSNGFLIRLDDALKNIDIVTSYPPLSKEVTKVAQDGLYFSPARQILEEFQVIVEDLVKLELPKYDNFFPNIPFGSYLGFPIKHPGQGATRYGIILLDENPNAFLKENKQKVLTVELAGYLFSVAIERAAMFGYMRRYESQYFLGQLSSDLLHEVSNKLNALDTRVKGIEALWSQKSNSPDKQDSRNWTEKFDRQIEGLSKANQEIIELFNAYSQQIKLEKSVFGVNTIVLNILRQLNRTAEQAGVRLFAKQDKSLPEVLGYPMNLKQAVLNLTLNAIQIYDLHQKWLKKISKRSFRPIPMQEGMVVVQTKAITTDNSYHVEIRIIDNGPGIHWRNWEEVFRQGYSERGGAGLGLYISRNMIERMGGKLILADSILFTGTIFVIRLPATIEEE